MLLPVSCQYFGGKDDMHDSSHLDSLIYALFDLRYVDPQRSLAMIDSLEQTGDLTGNMGDECRAEIYDAMGQTRSAAYYAQRSIKDGRLKDEDIASYYAAFRLLSHIYINNLDWRKALDFATQGMAFARETDHKLSKVYAPKYQSQIGSCQIMLGREAEGNRNYREAYDGLMEVARERNDFTSYYNIFAVIGNCIECNLVRGHTAEAESWLPRLEEAYRRSLDAENAQEGYRQYASRMLEGYEALVLAKSGKRTEAEEHYRRLQRLLLTADDGDLLTVQMDYLKTTGCWHELAALAEQVERSNKQLGAAVTMDKLRLELAPMFEAELRSGQREKALGTAERLILSLDSAFIRTQGEDAAQLATIYETQQKEQTIAEQQSALWRQQLIAAAVALGLLAVFFVVYALYRRRAQHSLSAAHEQLKTAYDQLEETTAQKERIESELRIARDIQMSMVPHEFPHREGLDLYALIQPAREVGGDLYGYHLDGQRLYFCLGDVSGKGVPASLFMAQATRLFTTLAEQGMMPAEICTRINGALSGADNAQGMFVTMFVGLVDLGTGRLDYCNAGHNPPVIGGGEHQGDFLKVLPNAPIGLWPELDYEGEWIDDIRGRALFLYTDGLSEAENQKQQQFGDDSLLQALRGIDYHTSQQVVEALHAQVELHRDGAEPNDVLTMMCLRFI